MKPENPRPAQLEELQAEIAALKTRLTEDETVIAALQAWTQYSFGTLLTHLHRRDSLDTDEVAAQIERVFEGMYRTLKQGYRGAGEIRQTQDGFDRLYMCSQATANMWQAIFDEDFFEHLDVKGTKLKKAALHILKRLDPIRQRYEPFESESEQMARFETNKLVFRLRSRRIE